MSRRPGAALACLGHGFVDTSDTLGVVAAMPHLAWHTLCPPRPSRRSFVVVHCCSRACWFMRPWEQQRHHRLTLQTCRYGCQTCRHRDEDIIAMRTEADPVCVENIVKRRPPMQCKQTVEALIPAALRAVWMACGSLCPGLPTLHRAVPGRSTVDQRYKNAKEKASAGGKRCSTEAVDALWTLKSNRNAASRRRVCTKCQTSRGSCKLANIAQCKRAKYCSPETSQY